MRSILFHVEQHRIIAPFLATRTLGDWMDRLFGAESPPYLIIVFALVCLCLLAILLVALAMIFGTIKGSWDFLRWLRISRDATLPCTNCGYDLRHKPERCPECGQEVWFKNRRRPQRPAPPPASPPADPAANATSFTRHPE